MDVLIEILKSAVSEILLSGDEEDEEVSTDEDNKAGNDIEEDAEKQEEEQTDEENEEEDDREGEDDGVESEEDGDDESNSDGEDDENEEDGEEDDQQEGDHCYSEKQYRSEVGKEGTEEDNNQGESREQDNRDGEYNEETEDKDDEEANDYSKHSNEGDNQQVDVNVRNGEGEENETVDGAKKPDRADSDKDTGKVTRNDRDNHNDKDDVGDRGEKDDSVEENDTGKKPTGPLVDKMDFKLNLKFNSKKSQNVHSTVNVVNQQSSVVGDAVHANSPSEQDSDKRSIKRQDSDKRSIKKQDSDKRSITSPSKPRNQLKTVRKSNQLEGSDQIGAPACKSKAKLAEKFSSTGLSSGQVDHKSDSKSSKPVRKKSVSTKNTRSQHLLTQPSELRPTVLPAKHFNASTDAKALHCALEGQITETVVDILCHRSNEQRQAIAAAFVSDYDQDLVIQLKKVSGVRYGELISGLMQPPNQFLCQQLFKGTDKTFIDILCSQNNKQINTIRRVFKKTFKFPLEEHVQSKTSGVLRQLLELVLAGTREPRGSVDPDMAVEQAKDLYEAGENRWGTDESVFNKILTQASHGQLQCIFKEYRKLTERTIEQAVKAETSGSLCMAYKAIINCAKSSSQYFAKRLHEATDGLMGADDATLILIAVSRSEIDLQSIVEHFEQMYDRTLVSAFKSKTSGPYQTALRALIGSTNRTAKWYRTRDTKY